MTSKTSTILSVNPNDDYIADGLPADKVANANTMKAWRGQRTSLVHSTPNSHTDTVCVALVTDLLLRLNPTSRIRSRELTAELNQLYPQILWDTRTVGRILSNIADAAEGCGAPETSRPLEPRVSQGLTTYTVNPTLLNWRWLAQVRHNLGLAAETQTESERKLGRLQKTTDFPWEAFTSATWGA
jgi:hypothetical protein